MILQERDKFKWDVMGLAETHLLGIKDKTVNGRRILYSGREDIHRSGVALFLNATAQKSLRGYKPVSDRILIARF
jgi:hypothetical protein